MTNQAFFGITERVCQHLDSLDTLLQDPALNGRGLRGPMEGAQFEMGQLLALLEAHGHLTHDQYKTLTGEPQ